MAALDLEQQAQIDQFKQLWQKYGNLITWVITLCLLAYAGWTFYLYRENEAAAQDSVLYEELDRSVMQGDAKKVATVFADMTTRYPKATYTAHGALLVAQFHTAQGKDTEARAALTWMVDNTKQEELVAVARLRLAGLLLDAKQYDPALAQLNHEMPAEFAALVHDRRGDVLSAQGKKTEAVEAYRLAYAGFDADMEYRRFIEGKLTVLGASPAPAAAASAPKAS